MIDFDDFGLKSKKFGFGELKFNRSKKGEVCGRARITFLFNMILPKRVFEPRPGLGTLVARGDLNPHYLSFSVN